MGGTGAYGGGNSGGVGGRRRRIPVNPPYRGRQTDSHSRKPPKKGCCAMVEAGRAARRGKYRLARRYAAMGVRLIAARLT